MRNQARRVVGQIAVAMLFATGCRKSSDHRSATNDRALDKFANQSQSTWHVVDTKSDTNPPIRFHFGAPEDGFAGEFPHVRGFLKINPDAIDENATGQFDVDIKDVTMGEPDLDSNVRDNVEFLQAAAFPVSSFVLRSVTASDRRLDDGRPVSITMHGIFKLKGVEIPLDVRATMTRKAESSRERILLSGSFEIEHLRERFHIAGPGVEGDPEGNQVLVEFNIELAR